MIENFKTLFLEINKTNFSFFVGEIDEKNNFKINFKLNVPLEGIENNRISNLEKVFNLIKENIYLLEEKLNYTFKDLVLIIENFNPKFINLSGFKKLNGSQISRENITYILNTLKSYVDKTELDKTTLHIFNSEFKLDEKKIENLPIGLFGNFYSHELSFTLINTNDYKNLMQIFDNCNLKIKKILLKSFIKGSYLSNKNIHTNTFFQIKINKINSALFYFENDALKFEQNFNFGSDIIFKDISKITSLKIETVKNILNKIKFTQNLTKDEIIEKELFKDESFRKIKKNLIYEIAYARIKEISELILFKNINLRCFNKSSMPIFFETNTKSQDYVFLQMYKTIFSTGDKFDVKLVEDLSSEELLKTAHKIAHFGWNKEAIPVTQVKKSLIAKLFEAIFS